MNPMGLTKKPPAVVVGFETNGLGVARALAKEGIPVIGIGAAKSHPATRTRCAEVRILPEWTDDALLEELKQVHRLIGQPTALLITKDEPVLWISRRRREIEGKFTLALPDPGTTDLLMSKQQFQQVAEQRGWPVPRTWQIETQEELERALPAISFPCILKPRVKNAEFRKHSPKKAFVLDNAQNLRATYANVAQWEREVVVQEYVDGGDDRVAFCLGYWDEKHQPLIIFSGRKIRQWPIQCGNTSVCEPAPEPWRERIEPLTRTVFRELGFRGLGSIEFKMRTGSDEPVIMEPTVGRTNFQNEVAVINGYNIPLVAYADALGLPIPSAKPARTPVQLVDELTATRAAEAYAEAGLLTAEQSSRQIRGPKQYMLFRSGDPGPFLYSQLQNLWRTVRRLRTGPARPADN